MNFNLDKIQHYIYLFKNNDDVSNSNNHSTTSNILCETTLKKIYDLDKIIVDVNTPYTNNVTTSHHEHHLKHNDHPKKHYPVSNEPKYKKINHGHGYGHANNMKTMTSSQAMDEWISVRNFKPTKMEEKQGVEKEMNEIRVSLNKITNKNYETHRDIILEHIRAFLHSNDQATAPDHDEPTDLENIEKITQFIFDVASTNKFYCDVYADLYKDLANQYVIFLHILNKFVDSYEHTIHSIQYIDSNENYDGYCDYTKMNDKRRATAMFLIALMKRSLLESAKLVHLVHHFQTVCIEYISQENRVNEVDEITELIFILVTAGKPILAELPEWNANIMPNITVVSNYKLKEYPSLSSRTIFKYKDLVKACS